jgi:hypothetical protein
MQLFFLLALLVAFKAIQSGFRVGGDVSESCLHHAITHVVRSKITLLYV